jgi:hypothetical protein
VEELSESSCQCGRARADASHKGDPLRRVEAQTLTDVHRVNLGRLGGSFHRLCLSPTHSTEDCHHRSIQCFDVYSCGRPPRVALNPLYESGSGTHEWLSMSFDLERRSCRRPYFSRVNPLDRKTGRPSQQICGFAVPSGHEVRIPVQRHRGVSMAMALGHRLHVDT